MKRMILWGCLILLVGCTPKKTTVKTEGLEEVIVFGEEEKPMEVTEPVFPEADTMPKEEVVIVPPMIEEPPMLEETPPPVIEEEYAMPSPPPPAVEEKYVPPTPPPPSPEPAKVFGFRIQIFASATEKNASKVADDARTVFPEKVYVDYLAPYYKVRIGDCLTREDAESLKNRVVRSGYHGAFVVETMIVP